MKVFVINLDRRKERMAYMERQLHDLEIDYERIAGIDGKLMQTAERNAAVCAFRWWCVNGYRPRDGEIGCALSHQKVYRMMLEQGLEYACIIEDDIKLDARLNEMLCAAEEFLVGMRKPGVLIMTPYASRRQSLGDEPSFKQVSWAASTGGYILTCSAAEILLAVNSPLQSTADDWGRWSKKGGIEIYEVNPIVCWQDEYGSVPADPAFVSDTIGPDTKFVRDMSVARRIVHKSGRFVGKMIDKMLS